MTQLNEHIIIDPKVLVGKPTIKGTRLSVDFILELLGNNWTYEQILENYPRLTKEDILAATQFDAKNKIGQIPL
ncbi:MAG: DUF433 domain-containing protein [Ignavibacteriales bacterium]|nr:DUF433 domain-containing protein [Ignavibacteriales bacterium]